MAFAAYKKGETYLHQIPRKVSIQSIDRCS